MNVTVIPIVTDTLGIIPKGLVIGLEYLEIREVETLQTTALLKSTEYCREFG